jgi:Lon protease-like protein
VIHVLPTAPINVLIQTLIKKNWPDLYLARARDEGDGADDLGNEQVVGGAPFRLPLFVINCVVFPGMSFPLHIFEPRYRLMLRRALEGSRHFGIACLTADRSIAPVGTTVEIQSHVSLMDGRSLVETIGRRRFNILSVESVDGYAVATVTYLDDEPDAEVEAAAADAADADAAVDGADGADALDAAAATNDDIMHGIVSTVAIRSGGRWDDLRAAVTEKYGQMPSDAAEFSMWLGSVLPIDDDAKLELLASRSVRSRLLAMRSIVRSTDSRCTVQ